MTDIGTLGGDWCTPSGIDDQAVVVGSSSSEIGPVDSEADIGHAFRWAEAEGIVSLFDDQGTFSRATAINNQNEIVGFTGSAGGREAGPSCSRWAAKFSCSR